MEEGTFFVWGDWERIFETRLAVSSLVVVAVDAGPSGGTGFDVECIDREFEYMFVIVGNVLCCCRKVLPGGVVRRYRDVPQVRRVMLR